jgi:polysaccharide export outer membrane protein
MKFIGTSILVLVTLFSGIETLSAAQSGQKPVEVTEVPDQVDLALPDNMSKSGVYSGTTEYRIGAQDLLDISVFLNQDLRREVRVNTIGEISMPLIGTVVAGGKTVEELEKELMELYGKSYLQNPQITVFIKEFTSQRVTLEGAVKTAGIFPIKGKTSLMQAIAMAGGVNMDMADLEAVLVFRTVNGQRMAARFNLKEIRAGEAADPQIYGDDIVVVGVSRGKWAYSRLLQSLPLFNSFQLY